jgi:hypothetical protein
LYCYFLGLPLQKSRSNETATHQFANSLNPEWSETGVAPSRIATHFNPDWSETGISPDWHQSRITGISSDLFSTPVHSDLSVLGRHVSGTVPIPSGNNVVPDNYETRFAQLQSETPSYKTRQRVLPSRPLRKPMPKSRYFCHQCKKNIPFLIHDRVCPNVSCRCALV